MTMIGRRVAVVTGGARGIGAEACRALAEDGLTLAVADLDSSGSERVAAGLVGSGHAGFGVDVSDETSIIRLFDAVERRLGTVTVLVHCAGIQIVRDDGSRAAIADTTLHEWVTTMTVNATGSFLTSREYVRRLPAAVEHGRIVTVSSVAAQLGGIRSGASYAASKAAILGLTKSLARELAPAGVTVNCIAPGMIDTAMLRLSLDPKDDHVAAEAIPLRYIGAPSDVAAAVRFLVSPGARFVTGMTLDVNGGQRMQ